MQFIRLNENWNADPNDPDPCVKITNDTVWLSFRLNAFEFKNFNEGDLGVLEFQNCRQYRMGAPNDEGFFTHGQSRFKQHGVEWGHFYKIAESGWETNFPGAVIINGDNNSNALEHFLFYFRDETFEIVAEKYFFQLLPK